MGSKQKLRKRTFLLVTAVLILTALVWCNVKPMTYVHADNGWVSGLKCMGNNATNNLGVEFGKFIGFSILE